MANKKFSDNSAITTINGTEILPITDDDSIDKKITLNQIKTFSTTELSEKQNIVSGAVSGDVASLNSSGQVIDSGILSTNITLQGNTFNGANQLLKLNSNGILPKIDGSLLSNTITEITLKDEQFITTSLTGRSYLTIKANTKITFTLNGTIKNFVNISDLTINTIDKLDTGTTLTAGKDYCIYLIEDSGQSSGFNFKVSLNASYPSGYSATTSYKIGGFHTLCVSVTSGNAPALATPTIWASHPAIGYSAGEIIPNSVWCLTHRPISSPYGMVYVDKIDKWVDIYLQSGTGTSTVSVYAGTTTDTRTQIQHEWDMALVNKKLATDNDFLVFAEGSNNMTNIYGSADVGTTGGHLDTASKRMISGYFIEDCCGFLWQWLDEIGPVGGTGWVAYGDENTRGQTYGMPYCLVAGGTWSYSSSCGPRSRTANSGRSYVDSSFGGRGVSLPLRTFIQ